MHGVVVQRELRSGDPPDVVAQVWDIDVVPGGAHDRVNGLDGPVGERDGPPIDVRDARQAPDPARADQLEVVLRERVPGHQDVVVRRWRAEVGGMPSDPDDAVAQHAAELVARHRAPLQHTEIRVPLPV